MDTRNPGGPPRGFTGAASESVNSVVSDISSTNVVSPNDPNATIRISNSGISDSTHPASTVSSLASFTSTSTVKPSEMVASFSGSITKTLKSKVEKCLFCQAIVDRSKCIKCSLCLKGIHFQCAESGVLDDNVMKVMQKKGVLHYVCVRCSPTAARRIRVVNDEGVEVSEDMKKAISQINFNEDYMRKQNTEIDRLVQKNTQLLMELAKGESQNEGIEITPLAESLKFQLKFQPE